LKISIGASRRDYEEKQEKEVVFKKILGDLFNVLSVQTLAPMGETPPLEFS
jgi:hypothetical protein